MKKIILNVFLLLFFAFVTHAQISAFDTENDAWKLEGDAQNKTGKPLYLSIDGNPDGCLSAADDGTGGIWYWIAPKKYLGNKCASYGQVLRFDLKTNTLEKQFDNRDIVIASPNMILYYDLPTNPDLDWTSFAVKLDESDNWSLNTFPGGPKPSEEDFFKVLSNVTAIKIRGEYSGALDVGWLDNVSLGGYTYLNLDADNSSRAQQNGHFITDTICGRKGKVSIGICDKDLSLDRFETLDSIEIFSDAVVQKHQFSATASTNISLKFSANGQRLTLINTNAQADTSEFKQVLQLVRAEFDATAYSQNVNFFVSIAAADIGQNRCRVEQKCEVVIREKTSTKTDKDTLLCGNEIAISLHSLLENPQDTFGVWLPKTSKKDIFSPKIDKKGNFIFIKKAIDECPADSQKVSIDVLNLPKSPLGKDTVTCQDSLVLLDASRFDFDKFTWNNGTKTPFQLVGEAGKYWLTMSKKHCMLTDTILLTNLNCQRCEFYIPNTFSPNDDGTNDLFGIYAKCEKINSYELRIFDRWGNLIFLSNDPLQSWNGTTLNKAANAGIYTYFVKITSDYKGKPIEALKKGNVLLVR